MTPTRLDDSTRHFLFRLRRRVGLRYALKACAGGLILVGSMVALLLAVDWGLALSPAARGALRWLPAVAVLVPLTMLARSARWVALERVALLADERAGLGNVVSTYLNTNADGPVAGAFRRRTAAALSEVDPGRVVSLRDDRLWVSAMTAVAVASLAVVTSGGPEAVRDRWVDLSSPSTRIDVAATERPAPAAALPTLGAVSLTVHPPAYSGLPVERHEEGDILTALPGSLIEIFGSGTANSSSLNVAVIGGGALTTVSSDRGWRAAWTVDVEARGVALSVSVDSRVVEQRVIPLRLLRDRAPTVSLTSPAYDLVLATPTGRLSIVAQASDDFGLSELTLHWVLSRGSGESFDFVEGSWPWTRMADGPDGRTGTLDLALDTMGLAAGDLLHVRAIATDRNTVSGPGVGVSATRQIRITREDDLSDVTTLIGFPIDREREPLLSQRMIILLTEELRDSASAMDEGAFREAAADIAEEQARLRARIGEQIFSRATGAMQDPEAHLDFEEGEAEAFLDELQGLVERGPVIDPVTGMASIANVDIPAHEHDSDPIVAINRSLLTVYNHMWDAERELRAAQLVPSLTPQHLALDELQRLRASERVFARGRVSAPPIDVATARGTGEVDDAAPARRTSPPSAPSVERDVMTAVDELLAGRPATGRSAALALSGLAIQLLQSSADPAVSEALARAATSAEENEAAAVTRELQQAARLLQPRAIRVSARSGRAPSTLAGAQYLGDFVPDREPEGSQVDVPPFVFATVRYSSGDWDSAPLVPTNLIHSMAQYTDLPVAPEGVTVDLGSDDVFEYPFLYLTGHLPVFFDEAEGANLVAFVDRGGFIFIDDHNHDIDGAFHRSVTSELQRLFGPERFVPIPNDHELYRSFFEFEEGPPITGHELSGWGDGLIHRELFGVMSAGRIGVLYSNKDYSSEWSYHSDNKRFQAIDNTRFGVNILVYALTR